MLLTLKRFQFSDTHTLSRLYVDRVPFCWVVEDRYRPEWEAKKQGETAIPYGGYPVTITFSNRFQCRMPLVSDVPNFTGIRIHPGNTSKDTEGCLLPGYDRTPTGVGRSRDAYIALFNKIDGALSRRDSVWLSIEGPFKEAEVR